MNEPRFRCRIPEIAEETERLRKRQQEREGPTGYETMKDDLLLELYLIEPPIERRSIRREIMSRMTKP